MGSPEFLKQCRELTRQTYEGKVPDEDFKKLMAIVPDENVMKAGDAAPLSAQVNVATAFFYGTVECVVNSKKKRFSGKHWGFGLAGFGSIGCLYTAYYDWDSFFREAKGYHVQCIGAAGGFVQVTWFSESGVPVGQYNGVAGGIGAMEVGGSGEWKNAL